MKIRILAAAFSLVASSALADDIIVSDFSWYGNDSYCGFQLKDQTFDYNDPNSWRFVFITNLPQMDMDNLPETPEEIAAAELRSYAPAFMMIDHGFHELAMRSGVVENGNLKIVYTTYGKQPYDIVLQAEPGETGQESQAFEGTITVSRGDQSTSVTFKGDCGV